MQNVLFVFVGGGLGCVFRYLSVTLINRFFQVSFPWGTALVNIIGSFIIGFLLALMAGKPFFTQNFYLLLVTGFLGGFTTFSAFSWDTFLLFKEHGILPAALNISLNLIGCLTAVAGGAYLAKQLA